MKKAVLTIVRARMTESAAKSGADMKQTRSLPAYVTCVGVCDGADSSESYELEDDYLADEKSVVERSPSASVLVLLS